MSDTTDTQDLDYQRAYRNARHHVKHLRGWYIHALVFTAVVGFLWLRYLFGDALMSWGLGVVIHGAVVSGFGQNWKEAQISRLMEKQGVTYKGPSDKGFGKR
jgi:2TM domain